MKNKTAYTKLIKDHAKRLGFLSCGISKSGFLEEEAPRLESWLEKNMHGKMSYMENHFDKRLDTTKLAEGSKSVISLLLNYYPNAIQKDELSPKISKYAFGKDYHFVIKDKLKTVYDPELPIDIYQLGLVYDIKVTEAGHCFVLHTLTSAFCPAADIIPKDIQLAVESIPGIKKCHTRITMTPPWTQESIDPQVRELLFGF